MNKTRLEAFSDGVFAILITIMVIEIHVPDGTEWEKLSHLSPVFISYLLSFIYLGIYWGNHHHLLHTVKRVTPGIIWANIALLFWLSLIPFATGWMGQNHFAQNAVILYAILLLLCGIAFTILQLTIQKHNKLSPALERAFAIVKKKGIASVLCYSLAIALAFVDPRISGLLFFLVAILWIVPDRHIEKAIAGEE
jgi:uncharacterized membrane protein